MTHCSRSRSLNDDKLNNFEETSKNSQRGGEEEDKDMDKNKVVSIDNIFHTVNVMSDGWG